LQAFFNRSASCGVNKATVSLLHSVPIQVHVIEQNVAVAARSLYGPWLRRRISMRTRRGRLTTKVPLRA